MECLIEGIKEDENHFSLLLASGQELKVLLDTWQGSIDTFVERLPLKVSLKVQGNLVTSPERLFTVGMPLLYQVHRISR